MKWVITIPTDVQPKVGEIATLSVTGRVKAVRVNPYSFHPIVVDLEIQTVESNPNSQDGLAKVLAREPYQEIKLQPQWTGGGET